MNEQLKIGETRMISLKPMGIGIKIKLTKEQEGRYKVAWDEYFLKRFKKLGLKKK